jgi:hypothetical protein
VALEVRGQDTVRYCLVESKEFNPAARDSKSVKETLHILATYQELL